MGHIFCGSDPDLPLTALLEYFDLLAHACSAVTYFLID